jgi:hypothetical protein
MLAVVFNYCNISDRINALNIFFIELKKLGMVVHRYTPVLPPLGRLSQKDLKFKDSLGYIARPCLKRKKHFCI